MLDIISVLSCLSQVLGRSALRQLKIIAEALLCMNGRITMLGISRWTGKGGSYRTVQRFFNETINWSQLQWLIISTCLLEPDDVFFIAGDTTTVTKSGKETYGLGKFFSSIYGKAVPGVSFLCLSLVSIKRRVAYPVMMEQVIKEPQEKPVEKSKKTGRPGRPKGSKNKVQEDVELSPLQKKVQELLRKFLWLIASRISVKYFVYDGEFGNNESVQLARQTGLHLISKLYSNAALYFPNEEPYTGKGAPKKYGEKVNYKALPQKYLQSEYTPKGVCTRIYQMKMWHKSFSEALNVLVLIKTHLKNGKSAHVVLFSSDLDLAWEHLLDYYSLRFQIEFNFRDAKQYWGLEDWMNIKETPLCNGANLAMFMTNVSKVLLNQLNEDRLTSVLDLKSRFHGLRYMHEVLKLVEKNDDPNINSLLFASMTGLGRIHHQKVAA